MRRTGKVLDFLLAFAFLAVVALASAWLASRANMVLSGEVYVIDGDSLMVDGTEVRLLGIDAPEATQSCMLAGTAGSYSCGKNATNHLRRLIRSGNVACEGWERDKYDRLLATCSIGRLNLNRQMVADGWAVAYGSYEREEHNASRSKKGVWSGEFENPASWRQSGGASAGSGWLRNLPGW